MHATIKKWGNSYAIRLTKADLEALSLREGDHVDVQIARPMGPIDLSGLAFLSDPDPLASEHHDRFLYGHARR